jgi:FtsZ-interacting cell division protein ZipA
MKDNRKIFILIVGGLMIFVIAAIFVVGNRRQASEVMIPEPVTEASSIESSDTGDSGASDGSASEATPEPAEATQEIAAAVPTFRAGLESTDPASVNLISGNIQLVEVFAFW